MAEPSSPHYVHGHDEPVLRSHRSRSASTSAAYLLPHLRPGLRLLDVGCGPGTITADFAALVAPGQVVAIDPSTTAVAETRALVDSLGLGEVDVTVADLLEPTTTAGLGRFDVVHAHQVLQHLSDPVEALRQMAGLCEPGGIVAVRDADYASFTWYPEPPALEQWRDLYRRLARAAGGEPDAGRRLRAWAREAGLHDVTATASVWCYASPEETAWWGGMWADRITDSDVARSAVRQGLAEPEDLQRMRRAWQEWARHPDAWFAVLHGEVLCRV